MPLRIAIDARKVRDFGAGTYIRNLVRALAKADQRNNYVLVHGDGGAAEFEKLPENFSPARYARPDGPALAQIRYSLFLESLRANVYHIPVNNVPLWMPKPYIVTMHDVGALIFGSRRGVRDTIHLHRLRQGLLRADRVIAVSVATRRDLEHVVGVPAARISTIYNAPDPAFTPYEPGPVQVAGDGYSHPPEMQQILDRYQINYPFLLYAGRTNPRKNIPRLVEAFAVIRGEILADPNYRDLRLIIIGDEPSKSPTLRHAVIQSRVEQQVRFLGFVPIETLRVFYQAAAAFVFPSLYEGFGLPPLEAMACGTPVVTSNVTSLPEVVGDAAMIVNPENVFDIARGIREVLLNQTVRARLIRAGFEQAKRFSWERCAQRVLEVYEEVGRKQR